MDAMRNRVSLRSWCDGPQADAGSRERIARARVADRHPWRYRQRNRYSHRRRPATGEARGPDAIWR